MLHLQRPPSVATWSGSATNGHCFQWQVLDGQWKLATASRHLSAPASLLQATAWAVNSLELGFLQASPQYHPISSTMPIVAHLGSRTLWGCAKATQPPALATSPSKTSDFRPGRSSVVSSRPLIGRRRRIEASSSDVVEVAKKEENKGRESKLLPKAFGLTESIISA
jgi:hypothetical protein